MTLVIAWRAGAEDRGVVPGSALVTLLALIVYPNTLYNTLPLMIPALVVMPHRSDDLGMPSWIPVVFVAGIYGGLAARVVPGFVALMAAWLLLTAALAVQLWSRPRTVVA